GLLCHFANAFPGSEIVLLDDGTDTVLTSAARQKKPRQGPTSVSERHAALRAWLRNRFVGLNTRKVKSVTFFTTYDFQPSEDDSIVTNTYARLRSLARQAEVGDYVYFLGQPLAEDFWMLQEDYR